MIRQTCRGMWRGRGVATAAVLTLAVGMAGALLMFALIRGVLLRPLPLSSPDRLVAMWKELPATGAVKWPVRAAEIAPLRDAAHLFAGVATVGYNDPVAVDVGDDVTAGSLGLARVSGNFFEVLGVRPWLGRVLAPEDDAPGAEPVLVLSHATWRQRFGSDRNAIGRRLTVGEQRFTIVGVMPPDVAIPRGVDAWMTIEANVSTTPNPAFQAAARDQLEVVARLRSGVGVQAAARALDQMATALDALGAGDGPPIGTRPAVRPLADVVVGDMRRGMFVLFAAVAFVLLIACANVANLLLVRAHGRRTEFAIRVALGASRMRLAAQIGLESLLIGGAAAALGLAVTWALLPAVATGLPLELPRPESVRLDAAVVIFALLLALVATVIAALVPAFEAARRRIVTGGRGTAAVGNRESARGRRVLVAVQVALAVMVVMGAGLIARTLLRLEDTADGLGVDRLVLVRLGVPGDRVADRERYARFLDELIARVDADPAVEASTPINAMPFSGVGWDVPAFTAEGQSAAQASANGSLDLEAIEPGYFETFGVPIVRGRAFDDRDRDGAPAVAVVSEDVAMRLWQGDAVGKRIKMGAVDAKDEWLTVVGVAGRTRYRDLRQPHATLYVPSEQLVVAAQALVVRTGAPLQQVAAAVHARVRDVDPLVRVTAVERLDTLLDEPLARPRFYALLLTLFGATALLLAAIGLYGVSAASVKQRWTEIGVRLSVGATPGDIRRLVLCEGLALAAIGVAAGTLPALAATRLLAGLLYEVHPFDPVAIAAAVLLLFVAAAAAAYLPARAAGRIEPLAALRAE